MSLSDWDLFSVIWWMTHIPHTNLNDAFWCCQSYLLWSFWPLICHHDSLWESPGKQSLEDTSVVPLPSSYTSQHQQVHQQAWQTITMVMARSGQQYCLGSGWLRPDELSVAPFFQAAKRCLPALWNMPFHRFCAFSRPRGHGVYMTQPSMCVNDEQACRNTHHGSANSLSTPRPRFCATRRTT